MEDEFEYDMDSSGVSEEEVKEESGDEYDPGGYTKLVVGKWEKQGYMPTPINRSSSFGAPSVIALKPKQIRNPHKSRKFSGEQSSTQDASISATKLSDVRATISKKANLHVGAIADCGSRRNKAFKMKLTIRRNKPSEDADHDSDFENSWEVAETSDNFDGSYESTSKLEGVDKNTVGGNYNQQSSTSSESDIRLFDTGMENYSQFKTLSNTEYPKVNEKEVAESAMKYYEDLQSALCALQRQDVQQTATTNATAKRADKNIRIIDGVRWRECKKCAKLFKTIREIKAHNKTHRNDPISEPDLIIIDGKRWRECSICQKRFHTRKELRVHIRTHTNEKPYECSVCGKRFKQLTHMKSHMKIHSGEKPHTCDMCGRNFSERSSLKRHIRRHLGIKPHKCTMCPNEYYTSVLLKAHMGSHLIRKGEMERFTCSVCNKGYTRRETLRAHMKTHDPEKQIKCPECDLVVLTQSHLKRHLLSHQKNVVTERNFVCGLCGKPYMFPHQLKRHMQRHTFEENRFPCDQCGLSFGKKSLLAKHQATHGEDRRFIQQCPHCDDSFLFVEDLNKHIQAKHNQHAQEKHDQRVQEEHDQHAQEKHDQHEQEKHDQRVQETHDQDAQEKHDQEKHDQHVLEKHSLKRRPEGTEVPNRQGRTAENKYTCHLCPTPRSFATLQGYARHKKKHNREEITENGKNKRKHFKCDQCNKSYDLESSLMNHSINKHRVRPDVHDDSSKCFQCSLCGYEFTATETFKAHLKLYHGLTDEAALESHILDSVTSLTEASQNKNTTDKREGEDQTDEIREGEVLTEEKTGKSSSDVDLSIVPNLADISDSGERTEHDQTNPSSVQVPYMLEYSFPRIGNISAGQCATDQGNDRTPEEMYEIVQNLSETDSEDIHVEPCDDIHTV